MDITFFPTADDFRAWLDEHHGRERELLVGFYKKHTGRQSITWPESVDEALCCGWIDGIRRSIDADSYSIRFTPRKPRSIWSAVNIARMEALIAEGRVRPAGLSAFEARRENRSGIYSYEQRSVELPDPYHAMLRENKAAWEFFSAQPASYRKIAFWWVISAKREATRMKRAAELVTDSAAGLRIRSQRRIGNLK